MFCAACKGQGGVCYRSRCARQLVPHSVADATSLPRGGESVPKGTPLAKRGSLPLCQSLSLSGEVASPQAMTERVSLPYAYKKLWPVRMHGPCEKLFATEATAACGGNREPRLGQRPAGCEAPLRGRSRRWEPQPVLLFSRKSGKTPVKNAYAPTISRTAP